MGGIQYNRKGIAGACGLMQKHICRDSNIGIK